MHRVSVGDRRRRLPPALLSDVLWRVLAVLLLGTTHLLSLQRLGCECRAGESTRGDLTLGSSHRRVTQELLLLVHRRGWAVLVHLGGLALGCLESTLHHMTLRLRVR